MNLLFVDGSGVMATSSYVSQRTPCAIPFAGCVGGVQRKENIHAYTSRSGYGLCKAFHSDFAVQNNPPHIKAKKGTIPCEFLDNRFTHEC